MKINRAIKLYDAAGHPDVINGTRGKAEVFREFMDTFGTASKDGLETLDMFKAYYANVSATVESDDHFEVLVRNAWHLSADVDSSIQRVHIAWENGEHTIGKVQLNVSMARAKTDLENEAGQAITSVVVLGQYGGKAPPAGVSNGLTLG